MTRGLLKALSSEGDTDLAISGEKDEEGKEVAEDSSGHHEDGRGQADAQGPAVAQFPAALPCQVAAHCVQVAVQLHRLVQLPTGHR